MIEAIYQIGRIQKKESFLEEFIEDIGNNNKHIFKIMIDITNKDKFKYSGIELEEFDSAKKMKYFYKAKKGNSPDNTPTSKVTTLSKTLKLKSGVFDKMLLDNKEKLNSDDREFILSIKKICFENSRRIYINIRRLSEQYVLCQFDKKSKDYKYKEGAVITLSFISNDKKLYVGDSKCFTELFSSGGKDLYKDYYNKYNKISKANNKKCYICQDTKNEVWGFVNTYNFYTADKQGFVSGGFKQELAWRNYPVCQNCAETLNRGKKYIENNLKYRFCGFNYLLIPELILQNEELLMNILKNIKKYRNFSLQDKDSTMIEKVEDRVIKELSQESNFVNFNFLFFEKNNASFKILLNMQEIAPSRLKYLISSKDRVDNLERKYDIFESIKTKKDDIVFNFSFTFIKDFFSNTNDGNFDKYFLEILNDIFINKNISFDLLVSQFMNKLRSVYLDQKNNWITPWVVKSYKIIIYIEAINQLNRRKCSMLSKVESFAEFFNENLIFDDNVKRAVFLEGVLAQKLLVVQYRERGSTPFRARLNGLKIDDKIVKRLLPEIINKLEEYGSNYKSFKEIESAISEYMLNCDFSGYSIDEISYYFTLGLTLEKYFRKDEHKNKEEE